jgi:hypothetical protein
MSYRKMRSARIGFVALVVTILAAGLSGNAVAKHVRTPLGVRYGAAIDENSFQPVQAQPVRLGSMHYYGGPKSPMWRGPVEN